MVRLEGLVSGTMAGAGLGLWSIQEHVLHVLRAISMAQPLSSQVDQSLLLPAPLSQGSWCLMMSVSLLSVSLLASALANSQ